MEFMSKRVWQQMTDEAPSILQTPVPDGYTSDGFAAAALKQCDVIATAGHRLRTVGRRIFPDLAFFARRTVAGSREVEANAEELEQWIERSTI
jgi:hypothetical protein